MAGCHDALGASDNIMNGLSRTLSAVQSHLGLQEEEKTEVLEKHKVSNQSCPNPRHRVVAISFYPCRNFQDGDTGIGDQNRTYNTQTDA